MLQADEIVHLLSLRILVPWLVSTDPLHNYIYKTRVECSGKFYSSRQTHTNQNVTS